MKYSLSHWQPQCPCTANMTFLRICITVQNKYLNILKSRYIYLRSKITILRLKILSHFWPKLCHFMFKSRIPAIGLRNHTCIFWPHWQIFGLFLFSVKSLNLDPFFWKQDRFFLRLKYLYLNLTLRCCSHCSQKWPKHFYANEMNVLYFSLVMFFI